MTVALPAKNLVIDNSTMSAPSAHGLLQGGRSGGVVHHQRHSLGMTDIRHRLNVGHKEAGIARRFDPDQFGFFVDQRVPGGRIGRVFHETECHIASFGKDGGGLFVAFPEYIQGGDDIVSRPGNGEYQVKQRLGAGTGRHAGFAAFQGRQTIFQNRVGRCAGPTVNRTGNFIEGFVGIGHGLDNRRHKGPKRLAGSRPDQTRCAGSGYRIPAARLWVAVFQPRDQTPRDHA